jgi:hypothetical protein
MHKRYFRPFLAIAVMAAPWSCGEPSTPSASAIAVPIEPAVTEANLLENERHWPYRVTLTAPWPEQAAHEDALPPGLTGVLIRIEESGLPRIDFGKWGKYEVPVERTDLVARANRIRIGEEEKAAPNFVHAIASRMLDSASEAPRPLPVEESAKQRAFLCVFADPSDTGFEALARALALLRERDGVMTILFPQGQHADGAVRERLRSLAWPVPYVFDFLSEPYTRTLLAEGTAYPYVMLHTSEGRVIWQGVWSAEAAVELASALDRNFGS